MRIDKRKANDLRKVKLKKNYIKGPLGSAYIEMGNTKVICTCSVENRVPPFLRDKKQGWITAEYGMLPGCTKRRIQRDRRKVSGRTAEIQRLIGRSLRAVVDMEKLSESTFYLDCDVIQADGGTRTASITAAFVALSEAIEKMKKQGKITENPFKDDVAAISVGIVDGKPMLDLCYEEDSTADVDMNVVMTDSGKYIEIQGTAESAPFSSEEMDKLLKLAAKGIKELIELQKQALKK
jgi:ribonuclease PH